MIAESSCISFSLKNIRRDALVGDPTWQSYDNTCIDAIPSTLVGHDKGAVFIQYWYMHVCITSGKQYNEATWHCCEPTCLCLEPIFDLDSCDSCPWSTYPLTSRSRFSNYEFFLTNYGLPYARWCTKRHPLMDKLPSYSCKDPSVSADRQKLMHKSSLCICIVGLHRLLGLPCKCSTWKKKLSAPNSENNRPISLENAKMKI